MAPESDGDRVYDVQVQGLQVQCDGTSTLHERTRRKGDTVPARFSAQKARTGNFARGPPLRPDNDCTDHSSPARGMNGISIRRYLYPATAKPPAPRAQSTQPGLAVEEIDAIDSQRAGE